MEQQGRGREEVISTSYTVSNAMQYDGKIGKAKRGKQLVLVLSTFKPEIEGEYRFQLWYKQKQGKVQMTRL